MPPAGRSRPGRASSPIDFDIELARKQSADNPVYYVQYAHARICSILRKAAEAGIAPAPSLARHARRRRGRRGPRARGAAAAGGRRGRGGRGGDARRHGVRDRARDDVPRLLPRPARRGPSPIRSTSAGRLALVDAARLALPQHPGPAGDLDPRADVTSRRRRQPHADHDRCGGPTAADDHSPTPSAVLDLLQRRRRRWPAGPAPAHPGRRRRRHPAAPRATPASSAETASAAARTRSASSAAVPGGLPHDRPRIVGALEADQPVAAPAIGCGRHVRLRAAIGQQDADAQLAQRLGVAR